MDDKRMARAVMMWKEGFVTPNGKASQHWVTSSTDYGRRYLVQDAWGETIHCECHDWMQRGSRENPCKHILAGSLARAEAIISGELAKGATVDQIKGDLIRWGCRGVEPHRDLQWTCLYEVICELENGELIQLPTRAQAEVMA